MINTDAKAKIAKWGVENIRELFLDNGRIVRVQLELEKKAKALEENAAAVNDIIIDTTAETITVISPNRKDQTSGTLVTDVVDVMEFGFVDIQGITFRLTNADFAAKNI